MEYRNGHIINSAGVTVELVPTAASLLSAVDSNFGRYEFINLTTGNAMLSGIVNGHPHTSTIVAGFTGLDTTITALPEYITALADSIDTTAVNLIDDIYSAISYETAVQTGIGTSFILANQNTAWVVSPIPAVFSGGMYIDIILPILTTTNIIATMAQVVDNLGNTYDETSSFISITRLPNTSTLRLQANTLPWVSGGYLAVLYKE